MGNTLYQKVLVPVDNSEQSQRAVETSAKLVQAGMIENIILFNVYPSGDVDITKLHNQEKLDEMRTESLILLKKYQDYLAAKAIKTVIKRAGGDPATLIIDLIENDDEIDLIIMGSRRLSKFQQLAFGSVTDKVTRLASIPVLVIK